MITQPSTRQRDWSIIASCGVPWIGSMIGFSIPTAPNVVQYVLGTYTKPITSTKLCAEFAVTADAGVSFIPKDGDIPGKVRLMIASSNWKQGGKYDRWFSWPCFADLVGGSLFITAPLLAANWVTPLDGSPADQFASILANPGYLGFCFGGASEAGHGVGVLGGKSTIELKSFTLV